MVDVIAIVLASTSRNNPLKYSIWNQIRPRFTVVVVVVLLWSFYFSFLSFFFSTLLVETFVALSIGQLFREKGKLILAKTEGTLGQTVIFWQTSRNEKSPCHYFTVLAILLCSPFIGERSSIKRRTRDSLFFLPRRIIVGMRQKHGR